MLENSVSENNQEPEIAESSRNALSAALSLHYITMALYALGLLGVGIVLILFIVSNVKIDAALLIFPTAVLILFLSHLLAVRGLKNQKDYGRPISTVLAVLLLLAFPFGTVLGVLLLLQLSKFTFDS
jgi:hypothetical protein